MWGFDPDGCKAGHLPELLHTRQTTPPMAMTVTVAA